MTFAGKKIPAFLLWLLLIVVVVVIFVSFVLMPYLQKKPKMETEHQQAVNQIQQYETTLANKASVEEEISKLSQQWETYRKQMYVDANTTIDDLQKAFANEGVFLKSLTRAAEAKSTEGITSATGAPLYSVALNMSFTASPQKVLNLLNYFESGSNGCYYIDSLACSDAGEEAEGDMTVNMNATLYYFVDTDSTQPTTAAPAA